MIAILGLANSGCWEGVRTRVNATVLSVQGDVKIVGAASGSTKSLDVRGHCAPNDTIAVAPSSGVAIALLPSVLLSAGPDSELRILGLSLTKDGDETGSAMLRREARIQLARGSICILQERLDVQAQPRLEIETSNGMANSAFDCLFVVRQAAGTTEIICVSGTLEFRPKQGPPVAIEPGHVGIWTATDSRMLRAESTDESQREFVSALAAEKKMRDLRSQKTNVFLP